MADQGRSDFCVVFTMSLCALELKQLLISWLSPGNFFREGGKIYCFANFYCYSIVFGPNFREGQKFSRGGGGKLPQGGAPCSPCGRKPDKFAISNRTALILRGEKQLEANL